MRDLDAVLVFMAGVAEDSSIKNMIETASRRQFEEDYDRHSSLPSIVSQIESNAKESSEKLSKEELNQVDIDV